MFRSHSTAKIVTEEYLERVKWLKETEMPRYGVKPSVETYNVLIKAFLALDKDPSLKRQPFLLSDCFPTTSCYISQHAAHVFLFSVN